MTGFHATRVTKARPYFSMAGQASCEHLPDDQPDENGDAERRRTRDDLERHVAETHPPPREGAAGGFSGELCRGHSGPYEWIFAIDFSATTSTLLGSGANSSLGP